MAEDASNPLSITYYLTTALQQKSDLVEVRQWPNLKVAFDDQTIWIKDFDYAQINSVEVKKIPFKKVFYALENKMFYMDSLLPERLVPSLLWTPIERALPITLPSFNHNYFGVHEMINLAIIQSEKEVDAVGMITTLDILDTYIVSAPPVRLEKISWVVLGANQVLLLGNPLLPIIGKTYWQRKNFIIPTGYDFDLHTMSDALNDVVNRDNDHWIIWNIDGSYSLVSKNDLMPLSLSSFRLSLRANKRISDEV